ncbi:hypothetical protein PG984_006473 [Apiospora sp. TS-2023a]
MTGSKYGDSEQDNCLAVKLAPEVELVALPVADGGRLVLVVGALVGAPDLGVVGEGEGAAPLVVVGHDAAGEVAVDEQVLVLGRGDLDLLCRVRGAPLPDLAPVWAPQRPLEAGGVLVNDTGRSKWGKKVKGMCSKLTINGNVGFALVRVLARRKSRRPDSVGGILAADVYGGRPLRCEWHSCNSGSQKALDDDVLEGRHFGER